MKAYKKIMDGVATVEKVVMSIVLLFVTVITVANVIVRKCTSFQLAWSEELVINLFVLLIMLGCALSIREGSMISLSLIFDRLNVAGKKVFCFIIFVANMIFWILLFRTGLDKVMTQIANGKRTFSLGWPEWVFTIFLPIGCACLILHNIEFLIDVFTGTADCVKTEDEGGND